MEDRQSYLEEDGICVEVVEISSETVNSYILRIYDMKI